MSDTERDVREMTDSELAYCLDHAGSCFEPGTVGRRHVSEAARRLRDEGDVREALRGLALTMEQIITECEEHEPAPEHIRWIKGKVQEARRTLRQDLLDTDEPGEGPAAINPPKCLSCREHHWPDQSCPPNDAAPDRPEREEGERRCDCGEDEMCNICLTPPWKEDRDVPYPGHRRPEREEVGVEALRIIGEYRRAVARCCNDDAGEVFCESFGCEDVVELTYMLESLVVLDRLRSTGEGAERVSDELLDQAIGAVAFMDKQSMGVKPWRWEKVLKHLKDVRDERRDALNRMEAEDDDV